LTLAGLGMLMVSRQQSGSTLRAQNESLRQELERISAENESLSRRLARMKDASAPVVPESPGAVGTSAANTNTSSPDTSLLQLLRSGEPPRLTTAQLDSYLRENRRSAGSLLAAYRTSQDPALLREAMTKYPTDPQVAFEAVFAESTSPAEKREWLENFKKAAPDNPAASYLSALDYFKAGQTDQALQEMVAASGKQGFTDYSMERIEADEEAFRSAGYSEADAKLASTWGLMLPQLAQFKALAQNLVETAKSYSNAGDEQSFRTTVQMALDLGTQLDGAETPGQPLISRLVGIAVEKMALNSLDPAGAFGSQTVQDQIDQLTQRRAAIKDLVQQSEPFQQQMTPQDWVNYLNRRVAFGEENAMHWLINRYGQ